MTIQCDIDNGYGMSITTDQEPRVGRGVFLQDASYGFESLDGFVVWYDPATESWGHRSMTITKWELDLREYFLNLIDTDRVMENNDWDCAVKTDPSPTPLFDRLTCTRIIPDNSDYGLLKVRYQPKLVVNAIGYRYLGDDDAIPDGPFEREARGFWEFGGQITLTQAYKTTLAAATLCLGIVT